MPARRDYSMPRRCRTCGGLGPFGLCSKHKDGLRSACKACERERYFALKAADPGRLREQQAKVNKAYRRRLATPGPKRDAHLARRRETRRPLTELQQAHARVKAAENRAKRIANGICESCTMPATHGIRCELHWFKNVAYNFKMTPHLACVAMLRELWIEQGGRCALTGEAMVINSGERARSWNSASLDHKVAQVNGGTHSKDNLQWVLFGVNASKLDMPQDEFINMCRKVVAHADKRVVHLRKVED